MGLWHWHERKLNISFLDPKTQAWIRDSMEPTFGYPAIVRFSWSTIKVVIERSAHPVKWLVAQGNLFVAGTLTTINQGR